MINVEGTQTAISPAFLTNCKRDVPSCRIFLHNFICGKNLCRKRKKKKFAQPQKIQTLSGYSL